MPKKLEFIEVKKRVESRGFILLDTVYHGAEETIKLVCKSNHTFPTTVNALIKGRGCPVCKGIKTSINQRTSYEELFRRVNSSGLKMVTSKKDYESNFPKNDRYIEVECGCKNIFKIQPTNLRVTKGCRECAGKLTGLRCRTPLKEVERFVKSQGYKLLSKNYINDNSKLDLLCPEGHIYTVKYGEFKRSGSRCTICSNNGSSIMEEELFNSVKIYFNDITKTKFKGINVPKKPFIKRFELDILNPHTFRGIEFDGTYYHSFKHMRKAEGKKSWPDQDLHDYHLIKDSFFLNYHNIKVLHIKEADWTDRKNYCIKLSIAWLGKNCSIWPKAPQPLDINL